MPDNQSKSRSKGNKLTYPPQGKTKRELVEEAEAIGQAIKKKLDAAGQASSLPAVSLPYGDGIQVTIKRSFIQHYMPALFSTKLETKSVMALLEAFFKERRMGDDYIADAMKTAPQEWEKVLVKMQREFNEQSVSVFIDRKEELINYVFSVLFSLIHSLAMVEVGKVLAKEYGNSEKLAREAKLPKPIANEIAAINRSFTKTNWANRAVKIQEIYTKKLFGVQRGGDNNTKFPSWKNKKTSAYFLFWSTILRFTFFDAIDLAKRLKPENRANILKQEFGDKIPEDIIVTLCSYINDESLTVKNIENFAYQQAAKKLGGTISPTYARSLYFNAKKKLINGEYDDILETEQILMLKDLLLNKSNVPEEANS